LQQQLRLQTFLPLHRRSFSLPSVTMAKNRNKKKKNGAVSMDTTDIIVSEAPQGILLLFHLSLCF
jgi:hypothetical protein